MAQLGPWQRARRVAVAVSGGADSLCLAVLAKSWGDPTALIVDHGLRAASAQEALQTQKRLNLLSIPSRILTIPYLPHGPSLAARARVARYAALARSCAELGLSDLLLGHHTRDQAETVLMRQESGSGPAGLAGMAPIVHRHGLRLVRPLLPICPGTLRATLVAAGIDWIEDPSNQDKAALRTRLRIRLSDEAAILAFSRIACAMGYQRAASGSRAAERLAQRAALFPEGYGLLSSGAIDPHCLAALIRVVGGKEHAPPFSAVEALAADPRPATLAGVRLMPAGRHGPGLLLVRELAAIGSLMPAREDAFWDGRFRLTRSTGLPQDAEINAVGHGASAMRRLSPLPAAVLQTLPAIFWKGQMIAVPHVPNFTHWTKLHLRMTFAPPEPACGAPYTGDAQRADCHHVSSQAAELAAPST